MSLEYGHCSRNVKVGKNRPFFQKFIDFSSIFSKILQNRLAERVKVW